MKAWAIKKSGEGYLESSEEYGYTSLCKAEFFKTKKAATLALDLKEEPKEKVVMVEIREIGAKQ